jgi:hypothetical protein
MKAKLRHFLVALMLLDCAHAQLKPEKEWSAVYDGPGHGNDFPSAVVLGSRGNFYMTGRSSGENSGQEIATIKYSSVGEELLTLRYNSQANLWDEGNALAVDDSGNIFVAGTSFVTNSRREIVLLKYSPTGSVNWKTYFHPDTLNSAAVAKIVLDPLGNIYLAGTFKQRVLFLKYKPTGILADSATVGDDSTDHYVSDLTVARDGTIYLVGYRSYRTGGEVLEAECAVIKIGSTGNVLWKQYLKGGPGRNVRLDRNGYPIVAGQDGTTAKYSPEGHLLWFRNSSNSTPSALIITGLAIDSHDRIVVSGYGCPENCFDYVLIKYDSAGNILWYKDYNTPDSLRDFSFAMTVDRQDNIYLTGYSAAGYSDGKCTTVKYDSSGKLIWDVTYSRSPNAIDIGQFISVDDSGNVYVGGYSALSTGWDYLVVKYRQDLGTGVQISPKVVPLSYTLAQNFPNPFNPRTIIRYSIPTEQFISLKVYDLLGNEVAILVRSKQEAGYHSIEFDASSLSSGVYFYRLLAGGFVASKKLLVLR